MRRSSIFNFDTLQARLTFPTWVIYLLTLLAAAELTLRLPLVTDSLPDPETTLWHAELIETKMDYFHEFQVQRGIDVLFLGNSTVQAGVSPVVFDQARGLTTAGEEGSFNGSIEGLPPTATLVFLEIYLRYAQPKYIILGASPQDLNSNSPWAKDVSDRVEHSAMAQAEAQRGLRGRMIGALVHNSALYRYRQLLYRAITSGGTAFAEPYVYFDLRGYQPIERRLADLSAAERQGLYEKAGVLNYSPHGEQTEALREILTRCKEQGIRVLLVNMPIAGDYYHNFDRPQDYQQYFDTLTQLAQEIGVALLDAEGLPAEYGFDDADFADLNHLNRAGAEKLSRMLAAQFNELVAAGLAWPAGEIKGDRNSAASGWR